MYVTIIAITSFILVTEVKINEASLIGSEITRSETHL
jgi:hypothetical protein